MQPKRIELQLKAAMSLNWNTVGYSQFLSLDNVVFDLRWERVSVVYYAPLDLAIGGELLCK